MKVRDSIFLAIASVLIAGCMSLSRVDTSNIHVGDSQASVKTQLGTPIDRQLNENREAWQYGVLASIGIGEYTVIWFRDSVVTGITTYRNSTYGGLTAGIRSVDWDSAPDATIIVKNR